MFTLTSPPNPELRDWSFTRERTAWLASCMMLVLIPHAMRIPVWMSLTFLVLGLWRVGHDFVGLRLPPRWVTVALTLAMMCGVYASYGTILGRNAGIALLAVLAGMKLIESRTLRDAYVLGLLAYFLTITSFLYSQSILTGVYMLSVVLIITATLITLATESSELDTLKRLRLAGTLVLQAIPIMIVLFVLFPRISGPLWGMPRDAHSAVSGLNDTMTPGSISELGLSDQVAFRVRFDEKHRTPPPNQLYWRGPVMWHTDGRTWGTGKSARSRRAKYVPPIGEPIDYTVILEPHNRPWLLALDIPTTVPRGASMTDELELRAGKPVLERLRYEVRSYPDSRSTRLTPEMRQATLKVPVESHPKARALARQWRSQSASNGSVVARALEYFRDEPFVYTLRPRVLTEDPIDQFLFDTREGFCENYAAAFTVLMRFAGIPARIVTGYQGGELNPVGDYLIVRQRDAHAWAEVWLEGQGWMRVDPTAAVSPSRIELGMDAAIPPATGPAGLTLGASSPVRRMWQSLRHGLDAISTTWNEWVLGYGAWRQRQLLRALGFDSRNLRQLAALLLGSVVLLMSGLGWWLARRPRLTDPVLRVYRRFCRKLERIGLPRSPTEGPIDYAARVARARPELAGPVVAITEHYVGLRYGRTRRDIANLRNAVARFSP